MSEYPNGKRVGRLEVRHSAHFLGDDMCECSWHETAALHGAVPTNHSNLARNQFDYAVLAHPRKHVKVLRNLGGPDALTKEMTVAQMELDCRFFSFFLGAQSVPLRRCLWSLALTRCAQDVHTSPALLPVSPRAQSAASACAVC